MRLRTSWYARSASSMASGAGTGLVARRQFRHRAVQLLAAGLVQELQLGLLAHQLHFDLASGARGLSCTCARSAFNSSSPARSASRCCASSAARRFSAAFAPRRSARPAAGALAVQLDVVRQQARALLAQALDLRRDAAAPGRRLPVLLLQRAPRRCARRGGALRAAPAPRAARSAPRPAWPPGPSSFSSSCRSASSACSRSARSRSFSSTAARLRSRCSAERSLSRRSRSSSSRATESRELARDRSSPSLRMSCSSATRSFSRACCSAAQPLQLGFQVRDLLVQVLQPRHLLVQRLLSRLPAPTPSSRASRFSASGPAAGLLAAADRVAVVADAVRQQEVEVRIGQRPAAAPRRGPPPGSTAKRAAAGPRRGP